MIDLFPPNIGARAPAGNKNQSRPRAWVARFDHTQGDALADIHLSLAYFGSGTRKNGSGVCGYPRDQKDNWSRKQPHRQAYLACRSQATREVRSTKNGAGGTGDIGKAARVAASELGNERVSTFTSITTFRFRNWGTHAPLHEMPIRLGLRCHPRLNAMH